VYTISYGPVLYEFDDSKAKSTDLTKRLKSNILKDAKQLKEFNKILPEAKTMTLVYTASTDGWDTKTFHTKC